MLVLFLQVLAALHFVGLIGLIAMLQMDRFDPIRRNLAVALLVTFGSGTGLVVLLEQIQPFIWDNSAPVAKKGGAKRQGGRDQDDDGAGGGGRGGGGGGGNSSQSSGSGSGSEGEGKTSFRPKGVIQDCENCPEMVTIAGGKFAMGALPDEEGAQPAEMPQLAEVTVPSFAIGRFEITRDQYLEFSKATATPLRTSCGGADGARGGLSAAKPGFTVNGWHPMVCVSWSDALKYAGWLSAATGKTYRLPTAAEWEYAARSGNPYPYQNGTRAISPDEARFDLTGPKGGTTSVGSFGSNAKGLFDLHGNAAEWVEDCLASTLKDSPANGKPVVFVSAAGSACLRVIKGGGWHSPALDVRVAARQGVPASTISNGIGFRLARELK
jgi:formylglycine-generating enzyme required for sulfatase activity